MPRIAKSLAVLRDQINAAYPNRSKSSDGWIGDSAHQATKSDHNPNRAGVVQALDITHDPARGPDAGKLAEVLLGSRDPRIKYIISNRRIAASYATGGAMPWTWRPYSGSNAHTQHVHISVSDEPAKYDDAAPWKIAGTVAPVAPPSVPSPESPKSKVTPEQRQKMGKAILDYEARRDAAGHLAVYRLPANDGGGTFEVAGINDRYHPDQANRLKSLLASGKYAEAEASAIQYMLDYTKIAEQWHDDPGVQFYLRDSVLNRGPKGAARILQRAVGVTDDGAIGPISRKAIAAISSPADLLTKLRAAREDYERKVVGYRANFWNGLVNRWNKALLQARSFQT